VSQSEKSRSDSKQCAWLIVDTQALASLSQEVNVSLWTRHATVRRPADNNEDIVLYRKKPTEPLIAPLASPLAAQ
jgi:hypothetical protein